LSRIRNSNALRYPLYDGFRRTLEQDRLSRLGCTAVAHDRYGEYSSIGGSIWNYLLPQLSHAIPAVNAAAASLGAVYELRALSSSTDRSEALAEQQYNLALRTLQKDISEQPHGSVPLLLACVLLASAEILQRRQHNALTHLQGAFQVLSSRHRSALETVTPDTKLQIYLGANGEDGDNLPPQDEFDLLLRCLDIQTSSYVLGKAPNLPSPVIDFTPKQSSTFQNIRDARVRLVSLIHSCYHFTAQASAYKYLPRTSVSPDLLVEQSRRISHLSSWLETLDRDVIPVETGDSHTSPNPTYRHALMLRTQCLVVIIYVSTVMSPNETAYDQYAPKFRQIVENSAGAFVKNEEGLAGLYQFHLGLGILQPLFFTALKYRHSTWRRKAVGLLRGAGKEGPWDGNLLAAVAARAIEIEEKASSELAGSREVVPRDLSERNRLYGCAMDAEA
jgi:hypothetical protein